MSFSNDFSSDFGDGQPRLGDAITVVFYWPVGQTTEKFTGAIKTFVMPEQGNATHLTTDIPKLEAFEVEIALVKANPVYTWVAEYLVSPRR